MHEATHIDTKAYRVKELASVTGPLVELWKIDGANQPSGLLTKALPREAFEKYRCTVMGWRAAAARGAAAVREG